MKDINDKKQRIINYLVRNPEQFAEGASNWCSCLLEGVIKKQVQRLTDPEVDLALQQYGL